MKKKYLVFVLLLIVSTVACFIGCGEEKVFAPYDKYTGETFDLKVDDYITIDGVLDEEIWANNKTETHIPGAIYREGSNELIDVEVYGERSATVYCYLGEKAIYFAFEVQDKNLYYNASEVILPSQNTRVEFYFTSSSEYAISKKCYYMSCNITNDESKGCVVTAVNNYSPYVPGWDRHRNPIRTVACAKIDGTVMEDRFDESYSTENNKGYVVEGAIDIALLGDDRDSMQFTAAFVQDSGFSTKRLNNSFIPGTSYLNVGTWKLMTNDGIIDDKTEYFDSQVVADEGVSIDGKLDDGIWENAVGRTVETTKYKNSDGSNKTITSYVVTTPKGLYIGMDSNDEKVYYHDGMRAVYSTGAEILIATNEATTIKRDSSLQWRYNVGGKGNRYYGDEIVRTDNDWHTGYPWKEEFFPALCAGLVKGDTPEKGMNTGNSDGWTGEIFIPWTSFVDSQVDYRKPVAVMICPFSAYELGVTNNGDQKRDYLAPVTVNEYGIGSQKKNPYEMWFLFKDGKPLYDGLSVENCYLDGMNIVSDQGVDYYEGTVRAIKGDDVVIVNGFKEIFPLVTGGTFGFNDDSVITVDNGDGTYTIKVPVASAQKYANGSKISFTANGETAEFNFSIETDFTLDGVLDEDAWSNLNKLYTTQTSTYTTSTQFTVALSDGAMYIGAKVTDPNFESFYQSSPIGLELYFNFGKTLSSKNTYQLRILANNTSGAKYYVYADTPIGSDEFSWTDMGVNTSVTHVFRVVNGGYEMEAKIPYSVFKLGEKPESVEIAVLTKFIKNTSSGVTASKFFGYEGNKWSRDQSLYLNFDETGFAPNKLYTLDGNGNEISEISVIREFSLVDDKYQGTVKIALTKGNLLVTDANFGEYNKYFDKSKASQGIYSFAIDKSELETVSELLIPVTSTAYPLNAKLKIKCNDLNKFYVKTALDANAINLWPSDIVNKDATQYYAIKVWLYGDSEYQIPVSGEIAKATFAVEGVDGVTSEVVSANQYVVYVPVSDITLDASYTLNATLDKISGSINFKANKLSDEDEALLKQNTKLYLNFNGGSLENAVSAGPDATMRRGSALITDGIYTSNQSQRAMQVQGITLGDSFTVSMLINGSDIKNTITNHYSNELFTTGNVDGKTGYFTDGTTPFAIRVKSSMLHIKMGVKDKQIYLNSALSSVGDGFERWTFTVNRTTLSDTTDEVEVTFYINGVKIASGTTTVTNAHDFNNVDGIIGIGAPAKYDDMSNPSGYVSSSDGDSVARHNIRMDNIVLYDGIMSRDLMIALDGYATEISK